MGVATGLDRLLAEVDTLQGRRFGLLSQQAAVDAAVRPAHLALTTAGQPPARLFGPEHGYYGVEQDMVAAASVRDPLTGVEVVSLYGDDEPSLKPSADVFAGLDLLLIDLQDVGSRYYTYAATAVWSAAIARDAGCEVWLLDRPNPLGGDAIEGSLRGGGFESFVGAFAHPVRHGLTLAEIALLELGLAPDSAGAEGVQVWPAEQWSRGDLWPSLGRPWIAPSPNMPSFEAAVVYPGLCLLEATACSEGRGTTRPFQLVGAPGLDPRALIEVLDDRHTEGLSLVPTWFRPQFQKHAGEVCGGFEIVVTDAGAVQAYRFGLDLLLALRRTLEDGFAWRTAPYEFVSDRPAIDLLTGGTAVRAAIDSLDAEALDEWCSTFAADEAAFRAQRQPYLLYD